MSIYGGYFGAGLGIMMLAVLGLLYNDTINRLNAHKQVLSLVVNVTAALFFVWTGKVYWGLAIGDGAGEHARRLVRRSPGRRGQRPGAPPGRRHLRHGARGLYYLLR